MPNVVLMRWLNVRAGNQNADRPARDKESDRHYPTNYPFGDFHIMAEIPLRSALATLVALGLGIGFAVVLIQRSESRSSDQYEHIRYEQNGEQIDKATYDREFQKNPASVSECVRNTRTNETLCAAG
ncbi:hypothetical protein H6F89_03535 [Cyanobacteria bacterium FACHB-63]|nr:hypothetical protein [Cyanobacteria bacterium FACHB-63]